MERSQRSGLRPVGACIRRLYTDEDRRRVLGFAEAQKRSIADGRVSSAAQKPDLKNQRQALEPFCISRGIAQVEFLDEVGGGMKFKRKVFTEWMDAVGRGEISKLIVAHKDRLVRFGFAWFSHFCEINGCEWLVLNAETLSAQQEMVQDLMTIVHCFSSRLHGLRNDQKALKAALTQ